MCFKNSNFDEFQFGVTIQLELESIISIPRENLFLGSGLDKQLCRFRISVFYIHVIEIIRLSVSKYINDQLKG